MRNLIATFGADTLSTFTHIVSAFYNHIHPSTLNLYLSIVRNIEIRPLTTQSPLQQVRPPRAQRNGISCASTGSRGGCRDNVYQHVQWLGVRN